MNLNIFRLAHGELEGPIVVGHIQASVATSVGATENRVWLSFDTLRKQLGRHPDLALEFYDDLSWLLLDGSVLPDKKRERCFVIVTTLSPEPGEQLFKATLKVVRPNGRIMLLSVHKIRPSDLRSLIRRAKK